MNINDKISNHFTLNEATYLPRWDTHHIPSDQELENIKRTALTMDKIRDMFGASCNVHCWIRPECLNNPDSPHNGDSYNHLVGGAPKSQHRFGLAVDFDITGMGCDEVRSALLPKLEELGIRMENKPGSNWVHIDLGEVLPGGHRFFIP